VIAFHKSLWLSAVALATHGVFDFFHHLLIQNSGVPVWWLGFCISFDVLAGAFLGLLLMQRAGFDAPISSRPLPAHPAAPANHCRAYQRRVSSGPE
jgi:hypothetical protein